MCILISHFCTCRLACKLAYRPQRVTSLNEMLVWDSYSKNGHWFSLKSELRGFEDLTPLTNLLQMHWQVQNRLGQKSQHHPIIEACFLRKPVYNRQPVWWLARNFLTCSGELYQWGTEPKSQSFVASALILQRRWSASYLLALAPRKLILWWKGQRMHWTPWWSFLKW